MSKVLLLVLGLVLSLSCKDRESVITIIDIGQNDRIELGKQLRIINKFSPKIVGLDFYLVNDSLGRDTILVRELNKMENTVQVVKLHDYDETFKQWDSLEVSHPKFKITNQGFANITTTDEDTIFVKELPMEQIFRDSIVYCFSYVTAENSFGVKSKYRGKGTEVMKLRFKNLNENFKIITIQDLASGNFRKEDLNNKIVLLGYVGKEEDDFYVNEEKNKRVNGIIIQASIIDELLDL